MLVDGNEEKCLNCGSTDLEWMLYANTYTCNDCGEWWQIPRPYKNPVMRFRRQIAGMTVIIWWTGKVEVWRGEPLLSEYIGAFILKKKNYPYTFSSIYDPNI